MFTIIEKVEPTLFVVFAISIQLGGNKINVGDSAGLLRNCSLDDGAESDVCSISSYMDQRREGQRKGSMTSGMKWESRGGDNGVCVCVRKL